MSSIFSNFFCLRLSFATDLRYYPRAMGICKHGHTAPDSILAEIHEGQEGPQRHKCTECAYDAGYQYGSQNSGAPTGNAECTYTQRRAPKDVIDALPESQAGTGRHKCAVCAYHEGFNAARAQAIGRQVGNDVARAVSETINRQKIEP